jgi:hypothetical protein
MKEAKGKSKDKVEMEVIEEPEITVEPEIKIEDLIMIVRNKQVMIDRDLAMLYEVDAKRLNEQVKRNIERFPEHFRFQLTDDEKNKVVANCDHLEMLKYSHFKHYVFTEQGIAMLSTVLRSDEAVRMSIRIMDAFVEMRKVIAVYAGLMQRMEHVERKQLEAQLETDRKFERVFKVLEAHTEAPKEGIFFDGQVFDAYVFVSGLIKSAQRSIILIDNYVDESVLLLLAKRSANVDATVYTAQLAAQLQLDLQKHNAQYPPISIETFNRSHDRFLVIDNDVYHIGASLKDLGKKWFAFSRMDIDAGSTINRIKELKELKEFKETKI